MPIDHSNRTRTTRPFQPVSFNLIIKTNMQLYTSKTAHNVRQLPPSNLLYHPPPALSSISMKTSKSCGAVLYAGAIYLLLQRVVPLPLSIDCARPRAAVLTAGETHPSFQRIVPLSFSIDHSNCHAAALLVGKAYSNHQHAASLLISTVRSKCRDAALPANKMC